MSTSSANCPAACYDLDLSKLEDEPLVIMAQEGDYEPARNELIGRFWSLSRHFMRQYGFRLGLQETDLQDAEQDATFWIIEAIGRYRSDEFVRPGGCHFRSFLYCVLRSRFSDALRNGRSYHLRHSAGLSHHPQFFETRDSDSLARLAISGIATATGNARHDAEQSERHAQLQVAVSRLIPRMQDLWSLLCQGHSLHCIAVRLYCSYDQVKRWRRKLLTELRASLSADE